MEKEQSSLFVAYRPDGSVIELPVIEYKGGDGPDVFLGITLHGDELTGQASLWKLLPELDKAELKGRLTIFPVMNPEGVNHSRRGIPYAEPDTNRVFPGDAQGRLGERSASIIFQYASQAEYVIDVHTAGESIPFILVDEVNNKDLETKVWAVAKAAGISAIKEYEENHFEKAQLDKSFTAQLMKKGIPALVIELGGGPVIRHEHAEVGYKAVKNILRHLGMLDGLHEYFPNVPLIPDEGYRREDLKTPTAGLLDYQVRLGSFVPKGSLIANIRNFSGGIIEEVHMPTSGYTLYFHERSVIHTGEILAGLAVKG